MAEPVVVEVKADTKDAERNLKRFDKVASSAFLDVEKNAKQMQAATKAATAGIKAATVAATAAFGALAGAAVVAVRAANEQEKAEQQLATALANSGQLTRENFEATKAYASELQRVTTQGDETTIALAALAINMGFSADEAQRVVSAATDMAAATGEDATSALKNMGKTLGGVTGRLSEVVPELKNLTQEQLKAGAAIDMIAVKFQNAAKGEAATFGGAIKQLSNNVGDLWEELGFAITQNQALADAVAGTSQVVAELIDVVSKNRKTFIALVRDGVALAVKGFAEVIRIVGSMPAKLKVMQGAWLSIQKAMADVGRLANALSGGALQELTGIDFGDVVAGIELAQQELADTVPEAEAVADQFDAVAAALEGVASAAANADLNQLVSQDAVDRANALKEAVQGTAAAVESTTLAVSDPTRQTGVADGTFVGPLPPGSSSAAARGAGLRSGVTEGVKDGMRAGAEIISGGIGAVVEKGLVEYSKAVGDFSAQLAGEIGVAVQAAIAVVQLLATVTPEEFGKMIDAFTEMLVGALTNLGPILVATIDHLDEIIIGLVEAVVKGLVSLVANLPSMLVALAKSVFELVVNLVPDVFDEMKNVFLDAWSGFTGLFKDAMEGIGQRLLGWLDSVFDVDEMGRKLSAWAAEAFGGIGEWIRTAIDDMAQGFRDIGNFFVQGLNWIIDKLNKIPFVDINNIPEFHTGGVVGPGDARGESMAMLQAGEVVVSSDGQARLLDAIAQGSMLGGGEQQSGPQITIVAPPESQGEFTQRVVRALDDARERGQIRDIRPGTR